MKLFKRKPKQVTIEPVELYRLHQIEQLAKKIADLLDDGKVDYDLLKELKGLLR